MQTRLAVAVITAMMIPASAGAPHVVLQIKPGLWEFTDTPKVSGDTVFSEAVLKDVPAAQRAQHLADLRRMMAQTQRVRECLTQARFEQQALTAGQGCSQSVVANMANRFELRTVCQSAQGGLKQSTDHRIVATPTDATNTMHAVTTSNGKTMLVDSTEKGRWLAASCGDVKDLQIMPAAP